MAARWTATRGSAGGHKARPYAMHFLFNFDEVRDWIVVSSKTYFIPRLVCDEMLSGLRLDVRPAAGCPQPAPHKFPSKRPRGS